MSISHAGFWLLVSAAPLSCIYSRGARDGSPAAEGGAARDARDVAPDYAIPAARSVITLCLFEAHVIRRALERCTPLTAHVSFPGSDVLPSQCHPT